MECRDAQFYLRLKRHAAQNAASGDELGPDVSALLDSHLATCPACATDARTASSFDRMMASAMRAVPIPSGLHEHLVAHVAAKQGAILRGKLYRGATAAAAALVLLFLGLGVFSSTRPKIDTNAIASNLESQVGDPDDSTREWLAAQKLPDRLPLSFDYNLLVFRDIVKVEGRDVPVMVFRSPNANDNGRALVYIIRENGRFDLKGIQDAQNSHITARVIVGQDQFRGVTYVVLYTGGPHGLEQFLANIRGT